MPCALSSGALWPTDAFSCPIPTFPQGDKNRATKPGILLLPPITGSRVVLMQWTFLLPSCSQEKKLLLNKEDSIQQHPLLLSAPKQQHPSGKRRVSCSLDKGALAWKRGVLNSSSDLWVCRCWTSPCQLKKWHNFLLQKSPKVKSNIG